MKATLKLHFYDKSDKDIEKLNKLLNPYGISFTPGQEQHKKADGTNITQNLLHIDVDEEMLKSRSEAKAGRPPKKIDYDRIVELKRKELDVNSICNELGISRALYYREVITSIDSLAIGTRIEYRPLDEDCWYKGTIQINGRGGKYVQGDDGIVDYPGKRDVIRKIGDWYVMDYIKQEKMKTEIIWNRAFMVKHKKGYLGEMDFPYIYI